MAVKGNVDFDVAASAATVMETLLDIDALPNWSDAHKSAEVIDRYDDGKPKRVKLTVSMSGITDNEILEYTWTETSCAWELVESDQIKTQKGSYTLTDKGASGCHVAFELEADLKIKLPGLIVKQGQKKALDTAKKGLTAEVEKRAAS